MTLRLRIRFVVVGLRRTAEVSREVDSSIRVIVSSILTLGCTTAFIIALVVIATARVSEVDQSVRVVVDTILALRFRIRLIVVRPRRAAEVLAKVDGTVSVVIPAVLALRGLARLVVPLFVIATFCPLFSTGLSSFLTRLQLFKNFLFYS